MKFLLLMMLTVSSYAFSDTYTGTCTCITDEGSAIITAVSGNRQSCENILRSQCTEGSPLGCSTACKKNPVQSAGDDLQGDMYDDYEVYGEK